MLAGQEVEVPTPPPAFIQQLDLMYDQLLVERNSKNWFETRAAALMNTRIPGHTSEYMTPRELIHSFINLLSLRKWK